MSLWMPTGSTATEWDVCACRTVWLCSPHPAGHRLTCPCHYPTGWSAQYRLQDMVRPSTLSFYFTCPLIQRLKRKTWKIIYLDIFLYFSLCHNGSLQCDSRECEGIKNEMYFKIIRLGLTMNLSRETFVTHTLYHSFSVTQWVVRVDPLFSVCSYLLSPPLWLCHDWLWRCQCRSRNAWNSSGVSAEALPNMSGCGLWVTCQWEGGGVLQTPAGGEDLPPTRCLHRWWSLTVLILLKYHECQLKGILQHFPDQHIRTFSCDYGGQKFRLEMAQYHFFISENNSDTDRYRSMPRIFASKWYNPYALYIVLSNYLSNTGPIQ